MLASLTFHPSLLPVLLLRHPGLARPQICVGDTTGTLHCLAFKRGSCVVSSASIRCHAFPDSPHPAVVVVVVVVVVCCRCLCRCLTRCSPFARSTPYDHAATVYCTHGRCNLTGQCRQGQNLRGEQHGGLSTAPPPLSLSFPLSRPSPSPLSLCGCHKARARPIVSTMRRAAECSV
jgi:hypothetical protein